MKFVANQTIGYSVNVTETGGMLPEDVEEILEALLNYADIPSQEELDEMLTDACPDEMNSDAWLRARNFMLIDVEVVHRESSIWEDDNNEV